VNQEASSVDFHIEVKKFIYDNEECKLVLLNDVTEQQLLEEERQKVKLMKMLTTTVSHDIMTPILTIKNFVLTMKQFAEKGDMKNVIKYY